MGNRSWKIFICCFLCAGIGTFASLQISHHFWWFGVLTGGFLGYLSYDFKKVIIAVPKAWNMIKGCKIDWCKIYATTKEIISFFISWFNISLNFSVSLLIILNFLKEKYPPLLVCLATILICFVLFSLVGLMSFLESLSIEEFRERMLIIRKLNFFRVYFYLLPKGIFWCIKNTPHTLVAIVKVIYFGSIILARFAKNLFIIIHSEWRLLCATDSAIGVLVGYIYDNILIGAMAGGIIGLINYEIISKRLLKLVPVKK